MNKLEEAKKKLLKKFGDMKQRCYNSKNGDYKNYGARGIKICDEWLNNPRAFVEWALNNGYEEGLTIDRENVNGDYEPSNCRWANRKTQSINRRAQSNNTSGYVGVGYDDFSRKWRSVIKVDGKQKTIGRYDTQKEAVEARNKYIEDNKLEYKIQQYGGLK